MDKSKVTLTVLRKSSLHFLARTICNSECYSRGEWRWTSVTRPISAGTRIGHVHLKVANLDRALGFLLWRSGLRSHPALWRGGGVCFRRRLPSPYRSQHVGERRRRSPAAWHDRASTTSPCSIRPAPTSPTRSSGSIAHGITLDGASDHGVSEALYLRDPDQNGVELYWDRPQSSWPRTPDGELAMHTRRLDVEGLLREAGA